MNIQQDTDKMHPKEAGRIMRLCAIVDAYNMPSNGELLELITEQSIDDTGKAKGELLGGNGQTQWGHCKGHIHENSGYDGTPEDTTSDELTVLHHVVTEHQTSIESNGNYNVRQLAHWRGGFDGVKYAKACNLNKRKQADHGYKIDKRKAITASELSNKELKQSMTNAEWQKYIRQQRKLAKQS